MQISASHKIAGRISSGYLYFDEIAIAILMYNFMCSVILSEMKNLFQPF